MVCLSLFLYIFDVPETDRLRSLIGAMTPFKKRSSSTTSTSKTSKEKRYPHPHPIPEPYQLNEISHLLATRGKADGSIEYF